jgi:tetrahydromethanopterin S-methyltransferase subunit D
MGKIIFILIAIILGSLVFYFTVKRKVKCIKCSSTDVTATDQKRYNEDNLAIHGSPNSYHEIGYKCNKCGNTFWEPKQSAIFN